MSLLESGQTTNLPPGGDHLISSPHLSVQDNRYDSQLKHTLKPLCSKMVFVMEKLWLAQMSSNKHRSGSAQGGQNTAHMSVEVSQED